MQSVVPFVRSVKFTALFVLIFSGLSAPVFAQPPTFLPRLGITIDENINGFWEYLPRNYDAERDRKYPLLIYFHGFGDSGSIPDLATLNRVKAAGPAKVLDRNLFPDSFFVDNKWFKFIVIAPQIKNGFDGKSSMVEASTIDAMIQHAKAAYRIDDTRIYMCGLSMGGGITWDYASSSVEASGNLAAIAVAAGASDLTVEEAKNIVSSNLPIVATHNTVDDVISVTRTIANMRLLDSLNPGQPEPLAFYWETPGKNNAGGNDNHNVWSRTFEDLQPGSTTGGNLKDRIGINVYEWMLQYSRSSAGSLPVIWKSFSVRESGNTVLVQWATSKEVNVKNFTVEKSSDGQSWVDVAEVSPGLPNDSVKLYSYTDASPFEGNNYYRIKQVDIDGKFAYSIVEKLNRSSGFAGDIKVYPNPFVDQISFKLERSSRVSTVIVALTNTAGALLKQDKYVVQQGGGNVYKMQGLQHLAKGIYYITFSSEDGKIFRKEKLIKQ